ncbi:MAG: pantetheine-phosphate adenylyltransferase [Chloroflexota bacterium]|nr:MAG: pantetheine-phosphate adenylyltransferase [Chloroflexota bacterium]
MTIAVYPGSFDPVTNGHLDIAARAARVFESVVMAVFDRPNKQLLFSTEERVALLREATAHMPRVRVDTYSVLTVDYVRSLGATVIVRGLRTVRDFETELQMAQIHRTLAPDIDVVLFMAGHQHTFVSSSMAREIASLGGDVSWLVPPHVEAALRRAYAARQSGGGDRLSSSIN